MSQGVPDWQPHWLNASTAAQYLCMSTEGIRRKVRAGVLPAPSRALGLGSPRWDRLALNTAMDGGSATQAYRKGAALVEKILAGQIGRAPAPYGQHITEYAAALVVKERVVAF